MLTVSRLEEETAVQLKKIAAKLGIELDKNADKNGIIKAILKHSAEKEGYEYVSGTLEVMNNGMHGFLRVDGVLPNENDVYVSSSQIQKFKLRTGDFVEGVARRKSDKDGDKYKNLLKVDFVGGHLATETVNRTNFYKKTPIFPNKQILLETEPDILSTRIIDLLAPIGYGQRGMIVSQPKSGKTWLLKDIAQGITANNPDIYLMVVLVGERPEEVTDMKRSVKGEVLASNFDEHPEMNVKVAEMALEKAMRMVEWGDNVVMLMDSITRLARAYNLSMPSTGRTLSGGFDPGALYPPKRFFGAARNFEEGGSLTILATALVDTGSKMDDLIYEEFKGTGNMELHLDRKLAERRVYPAIDVVRSGTRREDLLLNQETLQYSWLLRKMIDMISNDNNRENPTEVLLNKLKTTKNNTEFLNSLRD